jgi:hypothetical protein
MEYAKIEALVFDSQNFTFWNKRMKTFLQTEGFDVWKSVVDGYKTPFTPPTNKYGNKLNKNNSKTKSTILSNLVGSIFVKVNHCDNAKDIWDKLQNIYEGDAKVKGDKLQIFRAKFEQLKMKEGEDITTYLMRVDEIVNTINGLGVEVDESMVVQKVLRSLPMRFDPKILALEEREDLGTLSMDELHVIFTAYEMRTTKENLVTKEEPFKASKKTKKKNKWKSKLGCIYSDDSDKDEDMDKFVRKLKKGTDKYKDMLPLKCFNCGGIGHFSSKFPHKNKDSDEQESSKRENNYQKGNTRRNKSKFFKKIFYSKEDGSSWDEEDNDCDNDLERVLFMEGKDDSEEEGEVNLREELINVLEELRKERKKNKSLKVELKMKEGSQDSISVEIDQMIMSLKIQIE